MSRRCLPWRTLALTLSALSLLLPALALAEPCDKLSKNVAQVYVQASLAATEAYANGDYDLSIVQGRAALAICSEDERVEYNLARAYHQQGNCPMARYHYDSVVETLEKRKRRADRAFLKKAKEYQREVNKACPEVVDLTVNCVDAGVIFDLGPLKEVRCPFEGRMVAGNYTLYARRDGAKPYTESLRIARDELARFRIPALVELSGFGTLEVTCAQGVAFFSIEGPGANDTYACPWHGELPVGTYRVQAQGAAESLQVTVLGLQHSAADLDIPRTSLGYAGFLLGAYVAPGTGYAAGPLYDEGKATGERVRSLSHVSFALLVEAGWAFGPTWAALARLRLDQSLGVMGGLLGRVVPYVGDALAWRIDAGLGLGTLNQPVFLTDGRVPVTESGPFFILAGTSVAYGVSDLLSLVAGLDFNLGVNADVVLHLDLALGVELRF